MFLVDETSRSHARHPARANCIALAAWLIVEIYFHFHSGGQARRCGFAVSEPLQVAHLSDEIVP